MSLSSAFSNATSGLTAASKRAEIVSNNVANALTEGYGRRSVETSSQVLNSIGSGVRIVDIQRAENLVATNARRAAEVDLEHSSVLLEGKTRLIKAIGEPTEEGSLAFEYSRFETSLLAASNDPSNQIRLNEVVLAAKSITTKLQTAAAVSNVVREDADRAIANDVDKLNDLLSELEKTNLLIKKQKIAGGSIANLLDRRNQNIDQINNIIPVKVIKRDADQIALYTESGGKVFEGKPTQFAFNSSSVITSGMTQAGGALSGLFIDGVETVIGFGTSLFEGGTISSHFELRDNTAVSFNQNLDGFAEDLISRFADPSVDPTLVAGDAGLFTDAGLPFTASSNLGLAERVSINPLVDFQGLGKSERIRDGINSLSTGPAGDSSTIRSMFDAFTARQNMPLGMTIVGTMSSTDGVTTYSSAFSGGVVSLSDSTDFKMNVFGEARDFEVGQTGVDTDFELKNLIEIENAFSANARVLSTLDELVSKLLEI